MKSLLTKAAVGGVAFLGALSAFAADIEKTVDIDSATSLVQVEVIYGYGSGCGPANVDVSVRYSSEDRAYRIVRNQSPASAILDVLKAELSAEEYGRIQGILFPTEFPPPSICLGYFPIVGSTYIAINGSNQDEIKVIAEDNGYAGREPLEVSVSQFSRL